ncbi:MAG: hypothetical protein HYX57_08650 [Chloroflexi bacterium]|nr:hypothetical protein [Chloroflexota bacterium]
MSVEDGHRLTDDHEARRLRTEAALNRLAALGRELRQGESTPDAVEAIRLDRDTHDVSGPGAG